MFARLGLVLGAVIVVALSSVSSSEAQTPEKRVTLSPTSGPVGTLVTAELFNAPPNDPITVIFQIPGDPVVATGTTDANGFARFTFTVPYTPGGGTWPVFFTDFKCSCQIWVPFTITQGIITPTPTATPTRPPSTATPTAAATQTPQPPPPTATPTPAVPVLGTTGGLGGPGPNVGILALGMMAVITVLAWFAATRRGLAPAAVAEATWDRDDYSTDLDAATFDALLTGPKRVREQRGRGVGWALGAGAGAIAGLFLLRRK
jgi:hypothetical protein